MMRLTPLFSILLLGISTVAAHGGDPPSRPVDFNRDVRPLLSDRCFACHGPDASHAKGNLRLDIAESAYGKDTKSGKPAIVPGNASASEMVRRINLSADSDDLMPPTDSHKELNAEERAVLKRWIDEGAKYDQPWAYVPPAAVDPPKVKKADWPANFIDPYILGRLEFEGLVPSKDADRATLIRRVTFDLTGLPPTPAEVDAFVNDKSPDAYEKLIDRLLASPHYGERMAAWWLDLVRFADTVGYHGDQTHNVWPYRDYVINAFNTNKPLDKFFAEQLAGDLIPNATQQQIIATAYNRLLQTTHEGGLQAKEYRAIYMADRVRNVSQVFMGSTIGCAQCHNHKYDPYTARDFYALGAFFADVDDEAHFKGGSNSLPTKRAPEIEVKMGERKGKVMITKALATPRVVRVLPRGNWLDDTGEIVQPAVPEFMGKIDTGGKRATRLDFAKWLTTPETKGGSGGLTARVQANRLWALMMGSGIAKVLDDFGGQGEPPVHPELLDRLAVEFASSGWDIKHMMKTIAMSRTYRQSSAWTSELRERDPGNRLYARQSSPRLPAESIRDNALAVSGLLVREIGGPSVNPYQPKGYYVHLNFPQRRYAQHSDARQYRRGVYVHWQRQFLHPMMKAFDAPSREECTAERPESNTPTQALVLLNDPTFVESARTFAARILREGGESDGSRLGYAFKMATSRDPNLNETTLLASLLKKHRAHFTAHPDDAKKVQAAGLAPTPQVIDPIDLAAWTSVARTLLNLNETITRN